MYMVAMTQVIITIIHKMIICLQNILLVGVIRLIVYYCLLKNKSQ